MSGSWVWKRKERGEGEKREEKGRFMPSPWIVTDNNAVPRISTRPSYPTLPTHCRDRFIASILATSSNRANKSRFPRDQLVSSIRREPGEILFIAFYRLKMRKKARAKFPPIFFPSLVRKEIERVIKRNFSSRFIYIYIWIDTARISREFLPNLIIHLVVDAAEQAFVMQQLLT